MDTLINPPILSRRRLDLDVDPSWETQFVQCFNGLGRCLLDIDQSLVSSDLELLTSFLVDIRTGKNCVSLNPCRKRNRSVHFRVRSLCSIYDFESALIQYSMIVSFNSDSNNFMRTGHSVHHSTLKTPKSLTLPTGTPATNYPTSHAGGKRIGKLRKVVNRKTSFLAFCSPTDCTICRPATPKAELRIDD